MKFSQSIEKLHLSVWLLITLSIFVATFTAMAIYRNHPTSKREKPRVFLKYMWMFYGSLLGNDCASENCWYLRHVLNTPSFRCLQLTWLVGPCLILMSTYRGSITSAFAASKLIARVKNMDEMMTDTTVRPSVFVNTLPEICFKDLIGTKYEPLWLRMEKNLMILLPDAPHWLEEVADGSRVVVADSTYAKTLIGERFKKTGQCNLRVTEIEYCSNYLALAFRKGFPRKDLQSFNKGFMWYNEGRLIHRHMLESQLHYDTCTRKQASVAKPLKLKDLLGAFFLYAVGIISAIIVFILERFSARKNCKNH